MQLPNFKLEEFWKRYEFVTPYLLCCSDAESWSLKEILALADNGVKELWDSLHLSYTEPPGLPLLRAEIAKLYETIDADQLFTFAGTEEGIYCTMRALIEPGDHVVVIDPCYQSLSSLPEAFGADISRITLDPKREWQLELEACEQAFRKNTKLLVLNCPHNPTATLIKKTVWEGIIDLAKESGSYIFCDEVYRYMEIDESKRLPSIADSYEKGIALNVMTKSFGLAGLRIGWLASRDPEFMQKVGSYKLYTSICNSAPSEILALIALRAKERILQRNRKIMLDNLSLLGSFMERNKKLLSWMPPESGTTVLLELKSPVPIEKFADDLVQQAGILVMPGSIFDLKGNYFRIGFGKRNMASILERFEQFL